MDISKSFKEIIWSSPFYGIFLSMMNKFWDSVDNIRVIKKLMSYEIAMNEEYFESISADNRRAHILHEVIHIALMHPLRIRDFEHKELAHFAMDIVVNQYIEPIWWENCPVNYMVLDDLKNMNLQGIINPDDILPNQDVKYYYDILVKVSENISEEFSASYFGESNIQTGPSWNEYYSLSDIEHKLLTKVTEGMLTNTRDAVSRGRGNVPGELSGIFEIIDREEPPVFNWKEYLRKFVGQCLSTDVQTTRRKENHRFIESPGKRVKQLTKILVAIDTSGSVDDEMLAEFFYELVHINNTGVEVDVMQCDAKFHEPKPIKEYTEDSIVVLQGRGGTSFDPPCDYYMERLNEYQAIVYFTDGECSPPNSDPPNMLWIIPEDHYEGGLLPGTVIKYSKKVNQ